MKIKVKEKFVDSISGKKIYANKAENTTNGLNIDDSISSLSSTIKTKQDKLTFAGEDNTITAINSSAIKVDLTDYYTKTETSAASAISDALALKQDILTAGTDLVINNGVIGVNTNGSAIGNYTFVEGFKTSASW